MASRSKTGTFLYVFDRLQAFETEVRMFFFYFSTIFNILLNVYAYLGPTGLLLPNVSYPGKNNHPIIVRYKVSKCNSGDETFLSFFLQSIYGFPSFDEYSAFDLGSLFLRTAYQGPGEKFSLDTERAKVVRRFFRNFINTGYESGWCNKQAMSQFLVNPFDIRYCD